MMRKDRKGASSAFAFFDIASPDRAEGRRGSAAPVPR